MDQIHRGAIHQLAHDICNGLRSSDVVLSENVTFEDFHLSTMTQEALIRCGFNRPSPIQLKSIPLGRCGFDLVVQSKAGTGKTCIFTAVALEAYSINPIQAAQTLIIAPTREIAIQLHEVISIFAMNHMNLSCALCIGGIDVKTDRAKLSSGAQIVVGTPGRIKQLLELNVLKVYQIELFVLDEADKLMDEQFKTQIDEIYKRLPRDKQMIATSATYPNELHQFIQQYMKESHFVRAGDNLSLDAVQEFFIIANAGTSSKKSFENKMTVLKNILLNDLEFTKCFVFTNYQARAPLICDHLNKDDKFIGVTGTTNYLCAELPQSTRSQIFKHFKNSTDQKLLISTDLSARGIDIRDIDIVINFDLPHDNPTYYHRIGRAGRFGQPGKAITIVSDDSTDQALYEKSIKSEKVQDFLMTKQVG